MNALLSIASLEFVCKIVKGYEKKQYVIDIMHREYLRCSCGDATAKHCDERTQMAATCTAEIH
jgi:hypothetical protein